MEITFKTSKKYDYKLKINNVNHHNAPGKPFQVVGSYVKPCGENIYNGTARYFKNKAAAIHFYMKKIDSLKV